MKLKLYKIGVSLFLAGQLSQAASITTLLDALDHRPESRLDLLDIQKSSLGEQALSDKLMPKADLYAGYEIYNSPNGLLPVAPNELIGMVKDQNIGQPFSKQIMREGASFTWPLFVKSIYTLKEKARLLNLAAKEKRKLSLIQRQAVVVGSVAQLRYLEALKAALKAKKRSILQTAVSTKLKVKEGRAPQSALFILSSHINELDIALNNIAQNINLLTAKIETLTGVYLKGSVPLRLKRKVHKGEIFALKPLYQKVEASKKGMKAADEAYIPSIVTKGSYTYSQADAYNNGKRVHEHFGTAGLYITMPLFDSSKGTASQEAKLDYLKEKTEYDKTSHSLTVQAKQLSREIGLLKRSIILAKKSVSDQQKLLTIAKVSFSNGTLTEEEYLRYEDALANAKANLYSFRAKKWQDVAELAVIYGNNMKGIVK
ncbi:outer membrane efflux protein, putative [hydrothermal vent metagenome]|uniref:Outer membrane efflux protein, putative n=1 Tax=hydrothermal vent metagenome TaxID=652676 RepID=A0A1W1CBD9_9ZZZZ